jgi:hypothetical protein
MVVLRSKSAQASREVQRQREKLSRELDAAADDPSIIAEVHVRSLSFIHAASACVTCTLLRGGTSRFLSPFSGSLHLQAMLQQQKEAALSR